MGCDIHGWIERKVHGKWIGIKELDGEGRQRCYPRFAALAGVRGDGPTPKGLPDDISDTTRYYVVGWGQDGHSHSWLPLMEAGAVYKATHWEKLDQFSDQYPLWKFFKFELSERDKPDDFRLVFWFDN